MGHNEIKVDASNEIELERGSRIIQDMLKRGYALFVQGEGGVLVRVRRFNKKNLTYIIGAEATLAPEVEAVTTPGPKEKALGFGHLKTKAVPMGKAKVISVGRSAGG